MLSPFLKGIKDETMFGKSTLFNQRDEFDFRGGFQV